MDCLEGDKENNWNADYAIDLDTEDGITKGKKEFIVVAVTNCKTQKKQFDDLQRQKEARPGACIEGRPRGDHIGVRSINTNGN